MGPDQVWRLGFGVWFFEYLPGRRVIARACYPGLGWEMNAKLVRSLAPQQSQRMFIEQGMGLTLHLAAHPGATLRILRHSAEDLVLVSAGSVLQALCSIPRTVLPGPGGACPTLLRL